MAEDNKDEGSTDPFKIFLEEALERQRNAMMVNIPRILQGLPKDNASSSSSHFGSTRPFQIQVNFDIPIIEGQIDVYVIDKWLNI